MRLEVFKNYQQVHIWTGILSGLLLFICFVAGALTMFKAPLNQWALQQQSTLPGIEQHQYDHLIHSVLQQHPEAADEMVVYLPLAMPQHAPLQWRIEDPKTHASTLYQASLDEQGKVTSQQVSVSAVGDFIDDLHRTAGIPGGDDHDAYGIFVMGAICILYFVAIISGLIIFLPTWFKDLFALRRGKNQRRFWVDFHNILGVSALPFHLVIAVTTVVFAYHDLIYDSMQEWVYQDKPMFNRPAQQDTSRDVDDLVSIEQLQATIAAMEPDFRVAELRYFDLGTPRARVIVGGLLHGQWVRGPEYAFWVSDPYTASSGYTAMLPSMSGIAGKIVNGFFTLHFGGFGGSLVHWLYFAMGLSGALLFFTGNIIWIESRRKKISAPQLNTPQRSSVMILARLTIGVCLGTLVGLALALLVAKLLPHHKLDIAFWQQVGYYAGFLVSVAVAMVQKPIVSSRQLLILLCGLLTALIGATLWGITIRPVSAVDVGMGLTCAALLGGGILLLRHLRQRKDAFIQDGVWA